MIETERLLLRPPEPGDVDAIFRFVSDPKGQAEVADQVRFQNEGRVNPEMAKKFGKQLGADIVLYGTLRSIEKVIGSGFGDTITANEIGNTLSGGDGNDVLDGGAGIDTLIGAVPLVGDVFDLAFRSNSRNLRIIRKHLDRHHPQTQIIDM